MVFQDAHWDGLAGQGYTVVSGAIDGARIAACSEVTEAPLRHASQT